MQSMGGTTLKTLGIFAVLAAGGVYMNYGTLSPCGALRETVRKQDGLARILPDSVVDAVIESNAGPLSPGRCFGLLIGGQHTPAQTVATAPTVAAAPVPQPDRQAISAQANSPAMQTAGNEAAAAINECKAKRLAGELKSFVQSAQCSNPRIIAAFNKANYRYMDLVTLMTAKRMQIAERLDRNLMSEADANVAYQQAFTDIVTAEKARDAMRK
jgi:hypothetical protein